MRAEYVMFAYYILAFIVLAVITCKSVAKKEYHKMAFIAPFVIFTLYCSAFVFFCKIKEGVIKNADSIFMTCFWIISIAIIVWLFFCVWKLSRKKSCLYYSMAIAIIYAILIFCLALYRLLCGSGVITTKEEEQRKKFPKQKGR